MGHAKKSTIQIGLFNIPVRLEVAVDDESAGFRTVCTGGGTHDPVRVKQHVDCTECGASHTSVWGYPERGVEKDGKIVLVTQEDIKAATGEPIKSLNLSFHPREKVYAATVAGDSVQNIYPDKGGANGYKALCDALLKRPNMVAVTVWAPSTKNALWVLEVVDRRVVASKRAWPEDVRPAPAIAPGEVTDVEQTALETLIEALMCDFDVSEYTNAAKQGMDDLISSRFGDAVAAPAANGAPVTTQGDMLAALQAELARVKPAKPKAVKKAPAKKAVAKKVAVKKVAVKRPVKKSVRQKEVA